MRIVLLFISIISLSACATKWDKYGVRKTWQKEEVETRREGEKDFTLYLIGDTGLADTAALTPSLLALEALGSQQQAKSAVVVLGDNIYPRGLPPVDHPDRAQGELALSTMVESMESFTPHFWFIPGNHDWEYGLDGLKRQEQYLKKLAGREVLVPQAGCGDPVVEILSDHLVLVFLDTEWYIRNWDNDPSVNDGCSVKSRSEFFLRLGAELDKHRDKHIVLNFHHPLFTYGPHGGRYGVKDHIFPFAAAHKHAFIPLPVVGSFLSWMRFNIGIPQDVNYKPYKEFKKQLLRVTSDYDNIVFASGHEHTLQFIEHKQHDIVVSGSGSKTNPQSRGDKSLFSSSKSGLAKIDYFKNGASEISYFTYDKKTDHTVMLFRKELSGPDFGYQPDTTYAIDTTLRRDLALFEDTPRRSGLYKFLWGGLHRYYYKQQIDVPVLSLKSAGLEPITEYGNSKSKTIRLKSDEDRQYILRSIDTDASRVFYGLFDGTVIEDIFQDYFTASHPYAALAVPAMAESVGLYHTHPRLVYLPRQNPLGPFNKDFGDEVYVMEEQPEDDWRHAGHFGFSKNIASSDVVFKDISRSSTFKIDQDFTARNRVFDMIIGDWDRNEDRWKWSKIVTDSITYYRPIARDRDQAFSHYDGLFTGLVRKMSPIARQLQPFKSQVSNPKWINHNGFHFDLAYLNEMDWDDWEKAIQHVQVNLTGESIDRGLLELPDGVRLRSHDDLGPLIKSRRDNIRKTLRDYYSVLALEVDIPGTEESDVFIIDYEAKGVVRIIIYDADQYPDGVAHYDRLLLREDTKHIQLFGRDGTDQFILRGTSDDAPNVRIVGGLNEDRIIDQLDTGSKTPSLEVYDYPEGMVIESERNIKDFRSKNWQLNHYDHLEREYDRSYLIPIVNFETGVGLSTSLVYSYKDHGFKRFPYQSQHTFRASYGFLRNGVQFAYDGTLVHKGSRWISEVEVLISRPQFNFNFYGLTNEFFEPVDEQSFYQTQLEGFRLGYRLNRVWRSGMRWAAGVRLEGKKLNRSEGASSTDELEDRLFEYQPHVNLFTRFNYNSYPDGILPRYGLDFSSQLGYLYTVQADGLNTPYFNVHLKMNQQLFRTDRFILQMNFKYEVLWDEFFFYNAASLGGGKHLRGFFDQRFAGNAALGQSNDLFIHLFDWDTALTPVRVGIRGLFDYGRVWVNDENSDTWHRSQGGGIYFSTLDAVMITADLHVSEEGRRFLFGVRVDL